MKTPLTPTRERGDRRISHRYTQIDTVDLEPVFICS